MAAKRRTSHSALTRSSSSTKAINGVVASGLERLEAIEKRLREAGIALNLGEVKGPVMERLNHTEFLHGLSGKVFLTHYQAIGELTPEVMGPLAAR